jgi:hypothetical protein
MSYDALAAHLSVNSELSPRLIPDAARLGLSALLTRLPAFAGTQYLECRLGPAASDQVDFLVSVSRERAGELRAALAHEPRGDGWQPLLRWLRQWDDPSRLPSQVPALWLEFDDFSRSPGAPPNVCVCIVPEYRDPFRPLPEASSAQVLDTLLQAATLLRGRTVSAPERTLLERVVQVPQGSRLIHLSVMSARRPDELKLYGVFPQAELVPYLVRIGWPGDRAKLARLLERYCPVERTGGELYVDLPLGAFGDASSSELGICFSQQPLRHAAEQDSRRTELLSCLVEDGLCTRDAALALVSWPGEQDLSPSGSWLSFSLQKFLDIKIVMKKEEPLLAKAYLGFTTGQPAASWARRSDHGKHVPGRCRANSPFARTS